MLVIFLKPTYDPTIPFLEFTQEKKKAYVHFKTSTRIFTAALIVTAKNGNTRMFIRRWMDKQYILNTNFHGVPTTLRPVLEELLIQE